MLFEMQGAAARKRDYSEKQSAVLDRTNENVAADRVAALVRKVLDKKRSTDGRAGRRSARKRVVLARSGQSDARKNKGNFSLSPLPF